MRLGRTRAVGAAGVVWVGVLSVCAAGTRARAADAPATKSALRSLPSLKAPPVAPQAPGEVVVARPNGVPTDSVLRVIGEAPREQMGEMLVPEAPSTQPIVVFQVLKNGDLMAGQNAGLRRRAANDPNEPYRSDPGQSSPIDFWYDAQNRKLHVRSLLITENGDAPDFGLRRSGDGTYPNGPPLPSRAGQVLGLIHWTGWSGRAGFDDWSAMIFCRAAEDISEKGAGGTLHLATTPRGTTINPVPRVVIGSEGDVGVGTTDPRASLHVMRGSASAVAEDYVSAEALEPGDLVVATDEGVGGGAAAADAAPRVKKSSKPYDARLVGVVAANPALRVTPDAGDPNRKHRVVPADHYPVADAGRVRVKVCGENGPVAAGDYLTSSSTPGVAMRATGKGAVVGKALRPFAGQGVGTVLMLSDVTWYNP